MRQHDMHTLTQGIVSSHRARSSAMASLRGQAMAQRREAQGHLRDLGREVQGHLRDLATARQAAAGEQRAALSRGRAELLKVRPPLRATEGRRRSAVRGWLKGVATARQAAAKEVQGHLRDLATARQAAAGEQGAELAKVRPPLRLAEGRRRSGVQGWLKEVATARQAAAKEAQGHLRDLGNDRAAAHREWHDTVSALQAKRGGAVAVAEAPRPVTSAAPVEEAGEEELATLSSRAFDYLASHPNGTRLTEIEQELGMGRFQAARVVRHLTEGGKVEKRDLLYYAI